MQTHQGNKIHVVQDIVQHECKHPTCNRLSLQKRKGYFTYLLYVTMKFSRWRVG